MKHLVAALCLITVCAALCHIGCASSVGGVRYTYENKMLVEADSLFKAGNFEYAIAKYTNIRERYHRTPAGATAQYRLGYINIYYENPFADREAALREFKRFATMYPNDRRIDMVNNWIRILTAMGEYDENYYEIKDRQRQLQKQAKATSRNCDNLQDAYLNCVGTIDSLSRKITSLNSEKDELEKTISIMEKLLQRN